MPTNKAPLPYFGQPPREYDQRYMSDLARAFGQFVQQQQNPGNIRGTDLVLTDVQEGYVGLEVGAVYSDNGYLKIYNPATAGDNTMQDAFGRNRVSEPYTLFDSKQLFDNAPLFWDDSQVSGGSTTSTHSTDEAATTIGVAATTAGKRVRQTFQRFNYQPGKSQLFLMTSVPIKSGGGTGITVAMGPFDDDNGVFFSVEDGTAKFTIRSKVTGSVVNTAVSQSSWNGDKLDGTGASGVTLDVTKSQIFWMDMEWLGTGNVRAGFVVDGSFIVCHTFRNANNVASVYMSTPNLPLRYEIDNDGTGAASTMQHICSTVISEGGLQEFGALRYASTSGTHVDADVANTVYAVLGLRLKTTHLDEVVTIETVTMINATVDDYEWLLIFNPTVAGTFTFTGVTNSACETATGATANTVTGGTVIGGGMVKSSGQGGTVSEKIANAIRLGSTIAGVSDRIVLCVRPLSAGADIEGSITWREVS